MQKKILVVDDNQHILDFVAGLLEEKGHKVVTAEDGFSALQLLVSFTPDIIFVDLVMPLVGGDKLCKIVRKMEHLQHCYLVLVTAAASELDFDFTEIGADACIAKGPSGSIVENILAAVKESDSFRKDGRPKAIKGLDKVYPRQMTRELLDRNRHLETMLESMAEGIVEVFSGKVVYANATAASLFGMPAEQILFSYLPDLFEKQARLHVETLLKTGNSLPLKIDPDTPVNLNDRQVVIKKLAVKGDETTLIIIISDVTKRQQTENELKEYRDHLEDLVKERTAKLQQAQKMEAIGLLAGGVAHDLNNILAGLVSYPDLLLMDLPQDSPLRNAILTIKKSGQKASAIVQDLLTLARRGVSVNQVVSMNDIISEYLTSPEYNKLKLYHPRVEFETDFETGLLNIKGSPTHLSTTIMNLVSNAAEAMSDGGKIFISTQNRYIDRPLGGHDDVKEGDYVTLIVTDTGTGISTKDIERIFDPFYTKKIMGRSGTGLGMAVVWGTVKDHYGYIDVQSTKGKGTTFTLYFPVTREEISDDELLLIDNLMGQKESILVVDDVAEQREIASKMLTRLGYLVTSVSNGEAAIDYMKNNAVNLVVLDMIMDPGIDGLETYKRILDLHPEQKAVITSGFSETGQVKEAQRLGVGAYIKKPYTLKKLGTAVASELSQ